jgi:polar amino acid transport system substrate-binding protein
MRPLNALLLAFGLWLSSSPSCCVAATLPLCGDIWCPYNCDPGSKKPGFAIEILREIFAPAGYSLDYQAVNWARCIDDARAGRFAGIIAAIPTDAPGFTYSKQPIGSSSNGFAFRRGYAFHYAGPASLEGRVLGVVRSYAYNGALGAYIDANARDSSRIEFVSGNGALTKNLEKLAAGRVDVVLDDGNVLRTTIDELGLADRLTLEDMHDNAPVFMGFSPRAADPALLARIFDDGMARLRASGRLAAILAKYNVRDWAE